jgi:hypothetical protein
MNTITFEGTTYNVAELNAQAQEMVGHIQAAQAKLDSLKRDAAMVDVALNVYINTLRNNLPQAAVLAAASVAEPAAAPTTH